MGNIEKPSITTQKRRKLAGLLRLAQPYFLRDLLLASTRWLYEDLSNYFGLVRQFGTGGRNYNFSHLNLQFRYIFRLLNILIKKRLNWPWRSINKIPDIIARTKEKKTLQSVLTKRNSFRKVFINRFFLHKNKNTLWSLLPLNAQTLSQIAGEKLLQK